jgi:hypothetical protein
MDSDRFDRIAKTWGASATRRGALGLVASVVGLIGAPGGAGASCRAHCGMCRRCVHGRCRDRANFTACRGGSCKAGRCVPGGCVSNCVVGETHRECGPNGCGGTCGTCGPGQACDNFIGPDLPTTCCKDFGQVCQPGPHDGGCCGFCEVVLPKSDRDFDCFPPNETRQRCCGGACADSCDCCQDWLCQNGVCCVPIGSSGCDSTVRKCCDGGRCIGGTCNSP